MCGPRGAHGRPCWQISPLAMYLANISYVPEPDARHSAPEPLGLGDFHKEKQQYDAFGVFRTIFR
jgi:hypothetical protein